MMSGLVRKLSHPFINELKRYVANQNATLGPVIMSLSELIKVNDNSTAKQAEIYARQRKLSEVTDMIHAAHVFHRCVSDNICDTTSATAKRLHQDNVMSLLVGDYLLAQSSVDMAELRYPRTVGLIAKGLEDYTRGEFLKFQILEKYEKSKLNQTDICHGIERYAELTCGSLLSNACLSAALLAGHPEKTDNPNELSSIVFAFGFHTGSAHRLIEFLHCPDTNSEADKVFIATLEVNQFEGSIRRHLDRSSDLLLALPDGSKRSSLLDVLNGMRERSSISSNPHD